MDNIDIKEKKVDHSFKAKLTNGIIEIKQQMLLLKEDNEMSKNYSIPNITSFASYGERIVRNYPIPRFSNIPAIIISTLVCLYPSWIIMFLIFSSESNQSIGILIPIFWGGVFYLISKHSKKNYKKRVAFSKKNNIDMVIFNFIFEMNSGDKQIINSKDKNIIIELTRAIEKAKNDFSYTSKIVLNENKGQINIGEGNSTVKASFSNSSDR